VLRERAAEKDPLNLTEVILAQGSIEGSLFCKASNSRFPVIFDLMEIDMADVQISKLTAPIASTDRVFGFRDQAALWFSLGVGLLVMQAGASLMPGLSPSLAFWAILLGSVIGSMLLALVARLGQETGLSSGAIMTSAFGSTFGQVPVFANVVQLVGWAAFEIIIMRDGSLAVIKQTTGMDSPLISVGLTLIWGAILMLMMTGSMTSLVRRFLSRLGLPLVIASLLWLSYGFMTATSVKGWGAFWSQTGTGDTSFWGGVDLVIAMPVSWLPLVADYARFGRSKSGTANGTFVGYVVANVWCYALGALIAFNQPEGDLVTGLLLAQGGLIALTLIILDELDNAYGDLHSGAVSTESLFGGFSVKTRGVVLSGVALVLALVLSALSDSTAQLVSLFLMVLSSLFVPLFGVVLARYVSIRQAARQGLAVAAVEWSALVAWGLGVALYWVTYNFYSEWGSALPGFVLSFVVASMVSNRSQFVK